jgi:hypothetical protein
VLLIVAVAVGAAPAATQQRADTAFAPEIGEPRFPGGRGPLVLVDAAHGNFHTLHGRYAPFGEVLRRAGYRVRGLTEPLDAEALREARVLVVANALHQRNLDDWSLPTPSAFGAEEVEVVEAWVEAGGSLFLIADHMPFPGAAAELAGAFGFRFRNGFALDTLAECAQCPMIFRKVSADRAAAGGGVLAEHEITAGVDSVATFTGQAFQGAADAEPLLVLGPGAVQLLPEDAWRFSDETPREDVAGWLQGAVRRVGGGRVAVFGEAAQFSAQRAGQDGSTPMGMNAPEAGQNARFLLAVMQWLTPAGPGSFP